jgi:hypothetical protein
LESHQIELARAAADEESGGHPRSIASIRRAKSSLSGVDSTTDAEDDQSEGNSGDEVVMQAHPTSIAKLCPPDSSKAKLNMVCTWSALGGDSRTDTVHGQHHFTRLSVRPTSTTRGCPITITCKHPSQVSHDFEKGPLVSIFENKTRNETVLWLFGAYSVPCFCHFRIFLLKLLSEIDYLMEESTLSSQFSARKGLNLSVPRLFNGLWRAVRS